MAHVPGETVTHQCCICSEEANNAHGSIHHIFWLCDKHNKMFLAEEKVLKRMIEIQALRNVQKRYLRNLMES